MLDLRARLLPEGRRHEDNSLVRRSNITQVDRKLGNKCFVVYLLFICDVSSQHCVSGTTSIDVDPLTLRVKRTFELYRLNSRYITILFEKTSRFTLHIYNVCVHLQFMSCFFLQILNTQKTKKKHV